MSRNLLAQIDERANAISLSRSQYLCQLARQDLAARGDLMLRETPPPYGKPNSVPASAVSDNPDKLKSVVFPPGSENNV
jgi:hypothetical protein